VLKHARRATIALTTITLIAGTAVTPTAVASTPASDAGNAWLASQLQDGVLQSQYGPQYGPSLDVFFAFLEQQVQPEARQAILDAVEQDITSDGDFTYVGSNGESYAGPIGKLLTAVQAAGVAPSTYADGDLLPRLESLVHGDRDASYGRAMDESQYGDYSSTISQAWAVRAFAAAEHRFVKRTTGYLTKQQCEAGFFRESLEGKSCDTASAQNSQPSVDATALAVMALTDARKAGVPDLGDDVRQALRWLAKRQKDNGSFVGNGVPNVNSTGLAAWVLADSKWSESSVEAAHWLRSLQVTETNAEGTPLASEVGAVAYDRPSFKEGLEEGITTETAIEWALATAQSVVALSS
jgi:hypothetical protein